MRSVLSLTIVLALGACAQGGAAPPLDPRLHAVASTGAHRYVEYRTCSPEHCWSRASLEWLDLESPEPIVAASTEISELGYGKAVESATWKWASGPPRLVLRVVPSHGGFEPYTLVIEPGLPGQYESSRD